MTHGNTIKLSFLQKKKKKPFSGCPNKALEEDKNRELNLYHNLCSFFWS